MDSSGDESFFPGGAAAPVAKEKKANKRLSVERIYQKKTQLEHILLRPDTYIGSVQPVTEKMWIYDKESEKIISKEITYTPGLFKIYDEILVNAADHKQNDAKMDTIKIDINVDKNEIKIYNNGKGIPIVEHKDEKMYVPTMIFGHLLTSSNFNDEEEKVTGGRNGFGAKLCNVFPRNSQWRHQPSSTKRSSSRLGKTTCPRPKSTKLRTTAAKTSLESHSNPT